MLWESYRVHSSTLFFPSTCVEGVLFLLAVTVFVIINGFSFQDALGNQLLYLKPPTHWVRACRPFLFLQIFKVSFLPFLISFFFYFVLTFSSSKNQAEDLPPRLHPSWPLAWKSIPCLDLLETYFYRCQSSHRLLMTFGSLSSP